jgi:hypothetical protein
LLHPAVLVIYFQRFRGRKRVLLSIIDRPRTRTPRSGLTQDQIDNWRDNLDLNLAAYMFPAVICSLLSIAAGICLVSLHDPRNGMHLPSQVVQFIAQAQPSVIAGFAGAFVWGMYDFVDRFRILNLSPAGLHMTWFRLLLGPVMGYYLPFANKETLGPFLAFAIGTLPVPDIAQWARDKASSSLSITAAKSAVPRWELLQGLTPDIIQRLMEADVSSVTHLANQDPINLLRRTNLEWRNVLDMMDQAYLCEYVDDKIDKARARGIRGSIEMAILHGRLQKPETRAEAELVVAALVKDFGTDDASVRNLARNLYEDPQVDLIWTLWYERDDSSPRDRDFRTSEPPHGETGVGETGKSVAAGSTDSP